MRLSVTIAAPYPVCTVLRRALTTTRRDRLRDGSLDRSLQVCAGSLALREDLSGPAVLSPAMTCPFTFCCVGFSIPGSAADKELAAPAATDLEDLGN